jgi:hypothetical protein
MKPQMKNVVNQQAFILRSSDIELAVSRMGGHMAPVTFYRGTKGPVQPYHVSPWQSEKLKIDNKVVGLLRGDFFCLPFGPGGVRAGKDYLPHGEPSCEAWSPVAFDRAGGKTSLTLAIKCKLPAGKITHTLALLDGQNVVYSRHVLEGFSGRFPLGHHATLAMPDEPHTVNVAANPFSLAMTYPVASGDPAIGEYYSLPVGQKFKDLSRVPTIWKDPATVDFSSFPQPRGFVDIVGLFAKSRDRSPGWTTATFVNQGFVWFALKDLAVQPCLTIWAENHGRHTAPWSGRNNCLGLEDVVGYLATGMGPSLAPNAVNRAGIPTAATLSPAQPTAVNYIQGVVKVPRGFDRVAWVEFGRQSVTFVAASGKKATAPVNHEFVFSGNI